MGNDLFNKHINLVYKIAHRMNYGYIDLDDFNSSWFDGFI